MDGLLETRQRAAKAAHLRTSRSPSVTQASLHARASGAVTAVFEGASLFIEQELRDQNIMPANFLTPSPLTPVPCHTGTTYQYVLLSTFGVLPPPHLVQTSYVNDL